jgi:Pyridine nucleotide-disulphide oxidoreductase, dimerisation domain
LQSHGVSDAGFLRAIEKVFGIRDSRGQRQLAIDVFARRDGGTDKPCVLRPRRQDDH